MLQAIEHENVYGATVECTVHCEHPAYTKLSQNGPILGHCTDAILG